MNLNVKYSSFDKYIKEAFLKIDEDKKIDFKVIEEEVEDEITLKYFKITAIDDSIGMELEAKLDKDKLDEVILLLQRMKRFM